MTADLLLLAANPGRGAVTLTRRQRRQLARSLRGRRFAAGLVVDLGQTCDYFPSLHVISGAAVGNIVDLLHANTNCNIFVAGRCNSGEVPILIQTSPSTASGDFQDPTSGLTRDPFPQGGVVSGGILWINSGLYTSGNSSPAQGLIDNAPLFASGGVAFAHFQRPHRYARLMTLSGNQALLTAGFISQKQVTGSGGGFTLAPGSGAVTV